MFLTHHAGILLSHPGLEYLYTPPTPIALAPMLFYPIELLFMTTTAQLNKLPQTTIKFIIIDGIIRFNNHKIQTHALCSICVCHDGI